MILYDLSCEHGHVFEAWFSSSSQYDAQLKKKLINCPICNSNKIKKALMTPNLKGTKKREIKDSKRERESIEVSKSIKKLKNFIEKNTKDVGKDFVEEAKKIYYGETEPKAIRGETTKKQAEELLDEGIPIARLPWSSREDA